MTKPFDPADLVLKLKAQGLPVLETTAESALQAVNEWLLESAALHENPLVKSLLPLVLSVAVPLAKDQLDKIDGQPG